MRVIVHSTDVQLFLLLRHILGSEGFAAHLVMSPDEAKALCGKEPVGLVIIDGSLPGVDVAGYCHAIKAISPLIAMAILSNRPVGPCQIPELSDLVDLVIAHPFDPAVLIGFLKARCKIPLLKTGRSGETILRIGHGIDQGQETRSRCRTDRSAIQASALSAGPPHNGSKPG